MRPQHVTTTLGRSLAVCVLMTALLGAASPGSAQEYEPWVTDFGREAPAPTYTPWVTDFGIDSEREPGVVVAREPVSSPAPAFDWTDALVGAVGATLLWSVLAMGAMLLRIRRRVAA